MGLLKSFSQSSQISRIKLLLIPSPPEQGQEGHNGVLICLLSPVQLLVSGWGGEMPPDPAHGDMCLFQRLTMTFLVLTGASLLTRVSF